MYTVVGLILTLGILIVVHEYGHYWVARRCGVKVLRFSIGFGKPLWQRVAGRDRTEWVIAAVPLGGYVRMLDERDTDDAPIDPIDLPRAFNRQSVWKRIAIVLAGPVANLLLAVLVYWGLNVVGVMEPKALVGEPIADTPAQRAGFQSGDLVVAVDGQPVRSWNEMNWLILQRAVDHLRFDVTIERPEGVPRTLSLDLRDLVAADGDGNPMPRVGLRPTTTQPRVEEVTDASPAKAAGFKSGDRVLQIDQRTLRSANDLVEIVQASAGKPLRFVIERDGVQSELTVTPGITTDKKGKEVGFIGVKIPERPPMVTVSYGPVESLTMAVAKTWDTAAFSLRMLWKMITGEASLKNLSGPITIADYAGQTAKLGPVPFFTFLALVSISLGVLNLLPIPMLDGGHLLYYLIEIIKGSPPADWIVQWGQRAGVGLLVLLTALALYNDFTRLLL